MELMKPRLPQLLQGKMVGFKFYFGSDGKLERHTVIPPAELEEYIPFLLSLIPSSLKNGKIILS
jgi:hypothetical protein